MVLGKSKGMGCSNDIVKYKKVELLSKHLRAVW